MTVEKKPAKKTAPVPTTRNRAKRPTKVESSATEDIMALGEAMRETVSGEIDMLDTNVLLHDPSAIFHFKAHDVALPFTVLEELDHVKQSKKSDEVTRNGREVSRIIGALIKGVSQHQIARGIPLASAAMDIDPKCTGRLYLLNDVKIANIVDLEIEDIPDNRILKSTAALSKLLPNTKVVLVSKDINVRIKAAILGIIAEDYENDQVIDDLNTLYSGRAILPPNFWETHYDGVSCKTISREDGVFEYVVSGPLVSGWSVNEFLYLPEQDFQAMVISKSPDGSAVIQTLVNYEEKHDVWGTHALNPEQNFAFNVLMNPKLDIVFLLGTGGTGKTYAALAAMLEQVVGKDTYKAAIATRAPVPVGEDIGFLPGTEDQKILPWMGGFTDNLEVLFASHETSKDGGEAGSKSHPSRMPIPEEPNIMKNPALTKVKFKSLSFMRGRTFFKRFIIIDECQNLTRKMLKMLLTRAGNGTKFVCMGNLGQIDDPYITEFNSGLTVAVKFFQGFPSAASIILPKCVRSALTEKANEM